MRLGARFASGKLTLFSGSSTTSRTRNGEYLFLAEFGFHREIMRPNPHTRMVNLEQGLPLNNHVNGINN
jgi:hypothetical protein